MISKNTVTEMLKHHKEHTIESGESLPFIEIYINDEKELQFSEGDFNVVKRDEESVKDVFEAKYGEKEWKLGMEWSVEESVDIISDYLTHINKEFSDITHICEIDCPDVGIFDLEDLSDTSSSPVIHNNENKYNKIKGFYDHLYDLETEKEGMITPFPVLYFYKDEEQLEYTFGPAVHTLEADDKMISELRELAQQSSQIEVVDETDSRISAVHMDGWSSEKALNITEKIFNQILNIEFDEIDYAEIKDGSPEDNLKWEDV